LTCVSLRSAYTEQQLLRVVQEELEHVLRLVDTACSVRQCGVVTPTMPPTVTLVLKTTPFFVAYKRPTPRASRFQHVCTCISCHGCGVMLVAVSAICRHAVGSNGSGANNETHSRQGAGRQAGRQAGRLCGCGACIAHAKHARMRAQWQSTNMCCVRVWARMRAHHRPTDTLCVLQVQHDQCVVTG